MKKLNVKPMFFIIFLIIAGLSYIAFNGLNIPTGKYESYEIKGANKMRYGIDIRGGVEAIYKPVNYTPSDDELESARQIMEVRLDAKNITDREITTDKLNKQILVRFPWKSDETEFDPESAISELGETALLTFKDPDGNIVLEGKNVKKAKAEYIPPGSSSGSSNGGYVVSLEFDDVGAKAFADATKRLLQQQITISMDENIISAPTVQTEIADGKAQITGMENMAAATDLASKISSGALPFSMESGSNSTISPTLGQGALDVMVNAGFLAFILVCIFMLAYYRLPGFVACIALTLQVVGQLLALSVPQFTLTLPGIAAVILSIGMGVDANVIISARVREEINSGKSLKAAIETGFHRAFSSVFDGNITVIIVAIILMTFGSGSVLSFGYSLLTGVILNFLAGVTATRLMIKSLSSFKPLQKPFLFGAKKTSESSDPKNAIGFMDKVIKFYSKRLVFLVISAVIFITGIVGILINGINLDVEFKGGSILTYEYTGEVNTETADSAVSTALDRLTTCQTTEETLTGKKFLVVTLTENDGLPSDKQELLKATLLENFPDAGLDLYETRIVEPFIGAKFLKDGITAVILAFCLIVIYVWFSFRKIGGLSAGIMALVALVHDCFVLFFAFIVFKIPLNENFIAGLLTIIGFSVNDTIVIYDRIRENTALYANKLSFEDLVDKSITQSLSRSINTNAAVFVSILIVCIFAMVYGISSIMSFALPMTFGVISGCYSTICISGPLWVSWKNHAQKRKLAAK